MHGTITRSTLGGIAVSAMAIALLSGCGGSSSSSSSDTSGSSTPSSSSQPASTTPSSPSAGGSQSSGQSSGAAAITIKDYKYSDPGTVQPGETIMITNQDPEAHTLTADSSGGFNVNIPAGASASFKAPAQAGSYPFHCNFHSNMHGTLKVQ